MDTKTDQLIREGLRSEAPDVTKIIIAQRLSSVQDADMILVMADGCIMDKGTHEQLLKTSDEYRAIYELQTKNHGEADATEITDSQDSQASADSHASAPAAAEATASTTQEGEAR